MRFVLLGVIAFTLAASPRTQTSPAAGTGVTVEVITLPDFWGEYAIWGASGADSKGHIWLGITSNDDGSGSAHLFRYDPSTAQVTDTGDVVGALTRAGIRRPGEKQMKIHSRIVQMPDGYLYFASMDESGENPNGSKLPDWGGHLWRIGPSGRWEHLATAKEALIAVAAGGPYVYALGYFNHVVYQYDTRSGIVNAKTVGASGGHVSRNFFADDRGHVFVPRLRQNGEGKEARVEASLVELDPRLQELGSQPIAEYLERGIDDSHGIVATHPDGAGGWYFATGKGRLYQVQPQTGAPFKLIDLGWYHPAGPRYVASMYRDPKTGVLYGASYQSSDGGRSFELVAREPAGKVRVSPLPYGASPTWPHAALLYGSMTADASGRFYFVGTMNYKPVVLQITVAGT